LEDLRVTQSLTQNLTELLNLDPKIEAELIYLALHRSLPTTTWKELARIFYPNYYDTQPLTITPTTAPFFNRDTEEQTAELIGVEE